MRKAVAGVGTTPASSTSTPELASPAATAAARNSPETLPIAGEDCDRALALGAAFLSASS